MPWIVEEVAGAMCGLDCLRHFCRFCLKQTEVDRSGCRPIVRCVLKIEICI